MKAVLIFALLAFALALTPERAQMIKEINAKQSLWTAGENRFADKPIGASKIYLGSKSGGPKLPEYAVETDASIPTSFDSRTNWPKCDSIKEIRDQSTCGSCWAFGATEAATDRLCIHSGGSITKRLSAEDLLTCCESCGDGCDGGYPSAAWSWFNTVGVVTGGVYNSTEWCNTYAFPFCDHHTTGKYAPCGDSQPTPSCVKTCQSSYKTAYADDKVFFDAGYSVPATVEGIKKEIMTNGPIEVSMTVYSDFESYTSGIYTHTTGSMLGGHAIKMIGWGTENGVDYWLVANSWNSDWGEKGLFRIKAGDDECGIESQGVAGQPKLQF